MTGMDFLPVLLLAATFEQTITVTAERLEQPQIESTAAVTVLTRDDIERLPATTLGEILRFVPGLQIIDTRPGAPPMFSSRGFFGGGEVEYMQLVVDGVPAADSESGLAPWRQIAAADIERIEVLRGPGSSLFGDAAMGGVVQVFRRRSGSQVSVAAGSFTHRELGAGVSSPAGAGHLSANARFTSADGFREHSEFEEWTAGVRYRRNAVEGAIDASGIDRQEPGQLSAAEMATDPGQSNPLFANDFEETTRVRGSLSYDPGPWRIRLDAAERESDTVRTLLLAPGIGDSARRALDTSRLGLAAEGTHAFTPSIRTTYGAEASRETIDTAYESVAGDGRRDRAAAFFSAEARITPRIRMAGGLRWDHVADRFTGTPSLDEDALSPRLALDADFGWSHGYLQVARAFKAPTLDQRFDPRPFPDFTGGTFTISNPLLRAQKAWSIEGGLRGDRPSLRWEAVAYTMDVDDEIDLDASTFRYRNIGRSRHQGLESRVEWGGRIIRPSLAYTWTRAEPLQGAGRGKQLRNIAEHVARVQLATQERAGFATTVSAEHTAGRYLDDANAIPLEDATLLDLRLSQRIGPARIVVDGRNLTDRQYAPPGFLLPDFEGNLHQYFYPAPGRSLLVTLEWHFATGAAP
jgi:iron complex outermembrane receptor protein